jgi:hypothetical protein
MTLWISYPRLGVTLYPKLLTVQVTLLNSPDADDSDNKRHILRENTIVGFPKHTCILGNQFYMNKCCNWTN